MVNGQRSSIATIGFFDGVHLGHRHLINQVLQEAHDRQLEPLAVTFVQRPRQVIHHEAERNCLLTTLDEKLHLLKQVGVSRCEVMEFIPELASMTAWEFMQKLHDQFGVTALVIGYDHRFGHNRSEGFEDYVRYGHELGIEVIQATQFPAVSSSKIRDLLLCGDLQVANRCLNYDYMLQGRVVSGFHIGHTIGYPTANLEVPAEKLIPANGRRTLSGYAQHRYTPHVG